MQNTRPFDTFLIDLINKAKSCEFEDLRDSLITDRIVCDIDCKLTRERLLRNSDLTLEKAVTFVRACETSKTQVFELDNSHSADAMYNNEGKKSFEQNVSNRKMLTKYAHNFNDRQPGSSCAFITVEISVKVLFIVDTREKNIKQRSPLRYLL